MKVSIFLLLLLITGCNSGGSSSSTDSGSNNSGSNRGQPIAEQLSLSGYQRIYYGDGNQQFYDIRLPEDAEMTATPLPLIVLIHGGCWVKATADYSYFEPIAEDLTNRGYITINAEYRALGDSGGGWPGTFADIAAIMDSVNILAETLPIDKKRVAVAGHSAGGHLALWAGLREQIEEGQILSVEQPFKPALSVGLAAIADLDSYANTSCGGGITSLIGAQSQSDEYVKRLAITSPYHMNSSTAPTLLVQGQSDRIVPTSQATNYMEKLQADNAAVKLLLQPADHFSMLNVDSFQWQQTVEAIELMMNF